jgi:hypothetical protein
LTTVVEPQAEKFMESTREEVEPMIAASGPAESAEKRIVTVAAEVARAAEPPSRRKLQKKAKAVEINEPSTEGKTA